MFSQRGRAYLVPCPFRGRVSLVPGPSQGVRYARYQVPSGGQGNPGTRPLRELGGGGVRVCFLV